MRRRELQRVPTSPLYSKCEDGAKGKRRTAPQANLRPSERDSTDGRGRSNLRRDPPAGRGGPFRARPAWRPAPDRTFADLCAPSGRRRGDGLLRGDSRGSTIPTYQGRAVAFLEVRRNIGLVRQANVENSAKTRQSLPNSQTFWSRPRFGVRMRSKTFRRWWVNGLQYPSMTEASPRRCAGESARGDW